MMKHLCHKWINFPLSNSLCLWEVLVSRTLHVIQATTRSCVRTWKGEIIVPQFPICVSVVLTSIWLNRGWWGVKWINLLLSNHLSLSEVLVSSNLQKPFQILPIWGTERPKMKLYYNLPHPKGQAREGFICSCNKWLEACTLIEFLNLCYYNAHLQMWH